MSKPSASHATPQIIVVADDLTGAADCAARCVQAGLTAEIWVSAIRKQSAIHSNADVVALSTDSRALPPDEASKRTLSAMQSLPDSESVIWYKKIDSTLRGNLGAEIGAMLAAMQEAVAVICPAFPAQQRGLEAGSLRYSGAEARHLPSILSAQGCTNVGAIELAVVRQGVSALQNSLRQQREQAVNIVVVDGMSESDLATIVAATRQGGYLLCGSAGLLSPLASQLAGREVAEKQSQPELNAGPILAVVGSGSDMAHAQVAQVAASDVMRVRALDKNWYAMDLLGAQSHPIGDWLLHLEAPEVGQALEGAAARTQAARLADVAFAAIEKLKPSTLIAVGGDTAHLLLRRLGIEALSVIEELLPGIALTIGVDRAGVRRAIVLKPGNFGDSRTLVDLRESVHQRQELIQQDLSVPKNSSP